MYTANGLRVMNDFSIQSNFYRYLNVFIFVSAITCFAMSYSSETYIALTYYRVYALVVGTFSSKIQNRM